MINEASRNDIKVFFFLLISHISQHIRVWFSYYEKDYGGGIASFATYFVDGKTSVHIYCNGPLPLNGQLVTDVISAVTDADSYPITRNG
jgi:hypothetical protein